MVVTLTYFTADTGTPPMDSARRATPTTTMSTTTPAANRRYSPMVFPKIRMPAPFVVLPVLPCQKSLRRFSRASERFEEPAPVPFGVEDAPHLVAPGPEAVEAAVLELDARAVFTLGDEAHL